MGPSIEFGFKLIQEKSATWDFSLKESHGFLINRVGVSALSNGWWRNLVCRISAFRAISSSKNGASASTRRKVTGRRSLPRSAVWGPKWMVPFNPFAFRLCWTNSHETPINESFLFVHSYILKRVRALYDNQKKSYNQIESYVLKRSPFSSSCGSLKVSSWCI